MREKLIQGFWVVVMFATVATLVLGAIAAYAPAAELPDAAVAVIDAPEEPVAPGRLVIIDASESTGSIFLWTANEPYPAPIENWSIDSGAKKIHFATPLMPGKYAWTLTVIMPEATEPVKTGAQAQVVVVVGDPPPPPLPAKLLIKLAKNTVGEADNGGATSGTVTREGPDPLEDLPILVLSSDPNTITVSPLVTIPAGDVSVGFLVNAIDNDVEDGDRVVTISAESQGYVTVQTTLTVVDDEAAPVLTLSLLVDPDTFHEDNFGNGTVQRTGATTESLVVSLGSSDVTEATVPDTLLIPAGAATAAFRVIGVEDGEEDGDQDISVTAAADGYGSATAALRVLDIADEIVVTKLWGIVVYDGDQRDDYGPKVAQVILGGRLDTLDEDFTWLPFDTVEVDEDGNVPDDFKPWVEMLTAEELKKPHLFFVQQEGKLVAHMLLPESVDAVITEVRKHLPE